MIWNTDEPGFKGIKPDSFRMDVIVDGLCCCNLLTFYEYKDNFKC